MPAITAAAVAEALAAQGIAIAPARAERVARGLAPAIEAVLADARDLPFDTEAAGFAAALERSAGA